MAILVGTADIFERIDLLGALEWEGHAALAVTSGEEALASARRTRPEVVLLSLDLPGGDGIQLRDRLRSVPGCAKVPVILLVTLRDVEDSAFELDCGDDFVIKPIRPAELLLRLHSMLLQLDHGHAVSLER